MAAAGLNEAWPFLPRELRPREEAGFEGKESGRAEVKEWFNPLHHRHNAGAEKSFVGGFRLLEYSGSSGRELSCLWTTPAPTPHQSVSKGEKRGDYFQCFDDSRNMRTNFTRVAYYFSQKQASESIKNAKLGQGEGQSTQILPLAGDQEGLWELSIMGFFCTPNPKSSEFLHWIIKDLVLLKLLLNH